MLNGYNLSLLKSKFFIRRTLPLNVDSFFELHTSLSGGYIHNFGESAIRVNDAFYLQNFKGIRNLGYHYDDSENGKNKKGLAGDILGFSKYLGCGLKITHNFCPLLSNWGVNPFIFVNAALAPNRSARDAPE